MVFHEHMFGVLIKVKLGFNNYQLILYKFWKPISDLSSTINHALSVASYRCACSCSPLPIFRMLLFNRHLSKNADSFWRGAQSADVNLAHVFEVKSELFGA